MYQVLLVVSVTLYGHYCCGSDTDTVTATCCLEVNVDAQLPVVSIMPSFWITAKLPRTFYDCFITHEYILQEWRVWISAYPQFPTLSPLGQLSTRVNARHWALMYWAKHIGPRNYTHAAGITHTQFLVEN